MKAEKSRPAGGQAATQNNAQRKSTLTTRVHVARLVTLGESRGPIPIYGSPEWEGLPAADPRRFAAVVRAAEATPEQVHRIGGLLRIDDEALSEMKRHRNELLDEGVRT